MEPAATPFEPRNPAFEARVRDSFTRQSFMTLVGAEITALRPGHCTIEVPYRADLCQQHGYFHGGLIGTVADNAGGYAAFTLMAAQDSILTVEYKLNLLSPGRGERLVARSNVVRAGRRLTICRSDVYGVGGGGRELHCGTALVTLMTLPDTPDQPH